MTAKITIETDLQEIIVLHKFLDIFKTPEIEKYLYSEDVIIILDIREKLSEFLK